MGKWTLSSLPSWLVLILLSNAASMGQCKIIGNEMNDVDQDLDPINAWQEDYQEDVVDPAFVEDNLDYLGSFDDSHEERRKKSPQTPVCYQSPCVNRYIQPQMPIPMPITKGNDISVTVVTRPGAQYVQTVPVNFDPRIRANGQFSHVQPMGQPFITEQRSHIPLPEHSKETHHQHPMDPPPKKHLPHPDSITFPQHPPPPAQIHPHEHPQQSPTPPQSHAPFHYQPHSQQSGFQSNQPPQNHVHQRPPPPRLQLNHKADQSHQSHPVNQPQNDISYHLPSPAPQEVNHHHHSPPPSNGPNYPANSHHSSQIPSQQNHPQSNYNPLPAPPSYAPPEATYSPPPPPSAHSQTIPIDHFNDPEIHSLPKKHPSPPNLPPIAPTQYPSLPPTSSYAPQPTYVPPPSAHPPNGQEYSPQNVPHPNSQQTIYTHNSPSSPPPAPTYPPPSPPPTNHPSHPLPATNYNPPPPTYPQNNQNSLNNSPGQNPSSKPIKYKSVYSDSAYREAANLAEVITTTTTTTERATNTVPPRSNEEEEVITTFQGPEHFFQEIKPVDTQQEYRGNEMTGMNLERENGRIEENPHERTHSHYPPQQDHQQYGPSQAAYPVPMENHYSPPHPPVFNQYSDSYAPNHQAPAPHCDCGNTFNFYQQPPQYEPLSYYPGTIPCSENLIFSCAPNVYPAPCQNYEDYGQQNQPNYDYLPPSGSYSQQPQYPQPAPQYQYPQPAPQYQYPQPPSQVYEKNYVPEIRNKEPIKYQPAPESAADPENRNNVEIENETQPKEEDKPTAMDQERVSPEEDHQNENDANHVFDFGTSPDVIQANVEEVKTLPPPPLPTLITPTSTIAPPLPPPLVIPVTTPKPLFPRLNLFPPLEMKERQATNVLDNLKSILGGGKPATAATPGGETGNVAENGGQIH